MERNVTMTVRLTEEEVAQLEELESTLGYASRSETLRSLIRGTAPGAFVPSPDGEAMSLTLPRRFHADLDFLVGIDYHRSRDEVVYTAVKTYLYEILDLWKIKKRAEDMKEIEILLADSSPGPLE